MKRMPVSAVPAVDISWPSPARRAALSSFAAMLFAMYGWDRSAWPHPDAWPWNLLAWPRPVLRLVPDPEEVTDEQA